MAEIKVDCRGETCPVPLVEVRKALRKAAPGDVVEVEIEGVATLSNRVIASS